MSYYEIERSLYQDYAIYESPSLNYKQSLDGKRLVEGLDVPLMFKVDCMAENPPDDFPGSEIMVLSDRFIDALKKAGVDNMQCFDAVLINPETSDKWETGYKAVNFLGYRDCVDIEKSDCDEIGLGNFAFRDIAIDEKRAGGKLCFHIPQASHILIFHESVLDYLDEHAPDLEGMEYQELLSV